MEAEPVTAPRAHHDFLRYCLSGSCAYGVEIGSYKLMLLAGMDPFWANPPSRALGGIAAFLLHKFFSFQNRGRAHVAVQSFRYAAVWVLCLGVSQLFLWLYLDLVGWGPMLSKVAASGAAGVFAFVLQRVWTFR